MVGRGSCLAVACGVLREKRQHQHQQSTRPRMFSHQASTWPPSRDDHHHESSFTPSSSSSSSSPLLLLLLLHWPHKTTKKTQKKKKNHSLSDGAESHHLLYSVSVFFFLFWSLLPLPRNERRINWNNKTTNEWKPRRTKRPLKLLSFPYTHAHTRSILFRRQRKCIISTTKTPLPPSLPPYLLAK